MAMTGPLWADRYVKYHYFPIKVDFGMPVGEIRQATPGEIGQFAGSDWLSEDPTPSEERDQAVERWIKEYQPELLPKSLSLASFQEVAKEVWNSDLLAQQFYSETPFLDAVTKEIDDATDAMRYAIGRQFVVPLESDATGYEFRLSAERSKRRRIKPTLKQRWHRQIDRPFIRSKRWWWKDNVAWRFAKERYEDEDW